MHGYKMYFARYQKKYRRPARSDDSRGTKPSVYMVHEFVCTSVTQATFVFGNQLRNLFEAIVFLFVVHPYDVGDRVYIDNDNFLVCRASFFSVHAQWKVLNVYDKHVCEYAQGSRDRPTVHDILEAEWRVRDHTELSRPGEQEDHECQALQADDGRV